MRRHIFVYGIVAVLLLVAARYDLAINQLLYHPSSYFGYFMEHIYVLLPILVLPFTFTMLVSYKANLWTWLIAFIACLYGAQQIDHYILSSNNVLVIALWGIGLLMLFLWFNHFIPSTTKKKILPFLLFCCIVLILSSTIIGVLKLLWGRVRFRSMNGEALFTPWYLPQGYNGHKSFPSGHTTAASMTLCLLTFPSFFNRKLRPWMVIIAFASPILMAISRMIMGAHYLSDTTVAFFIVYSVVIILESKYLKVK